MENEKLEKLAQLAQEQANLYRALLDLELDSSPIDAWRYLNHGYLLTATETRFAIHKYIRGQVVAWVRRDDPERWSKLTYKYLKICGL